MIPKTLIVFNFQAIISVAGEVMKLSLWIEILIKVVVQCQKINGIPTVWEPHSTMASG